MEATGGVPEKGKTEVGYFVNGVFFPITEEEPDDPRPFVEEMDMAVRKQIQKLMDEVLMETDYGRFNQYR